MRRTGNVLGDSFRLAAPYFSRSPERWSARIVLGVILVLGFVNVGVSVVLNYWYGSFYDALQNRNLPDFITLLLWYRWDEHGFTIGFVPLVTLAVPLSILRLYLEQFLQIRWRRWLTADVLSDWVAKRAYYTLSVT